MSHASRPLRPALALATLALLTSLSATACLSWHEGPLPGEPSNATFVEVDGVRVRYLDRGQGAPVVLIHGFASSLDAWGTVVPTLVDAGHRVIALDLKGFGWSERPPGDYSPAAQARLVFALLDHLDVDRAAVVAHSWGSSVALTMAMEGASRVERVALYDAWVYDDQLPSFFVWARADGLGEMLMWLFYDERPQDKIAQAFADPSVLPQAFVDEVEAQLDRPGTEAAALAAIRGQRFDELEVGYPTVAQPVLLLWGEEDRVTRLSYGEQLLRELPDARLVTYPGVGHFPMLEAAGASTRELVEFLEPWRAAPPAADPDDDAAPPVAAVPTEDAP